MFCRDVRNGLHGYLHGYGGVDGVISLEGVDVNCVTQFCSFCLGTSFTFLFVGIFIDIGRS